MSIERILNPGPLSYEFEHDGETYEAEITPQTKRQLGQVHVPSVGTYTGVSTSLTIRSRHCCGAQGYDPMLGDTCDACEERREKDGLMEALKEELRERGVLEAYKR